MSPLLCQGPHFQNAVPHVPNQVYVFIPLPTDLYALFIFPRKNADLREIVAKGANLEDFRRAVVGLRERYLPFHTGDSEFELPEELEIFNLDHPPWICQPYVRPAPEIYLEKMRKIAEEEKKEREEQKKAVPLDENKRSAEDEKGEPVLSKTKRKKLERKAMKDKWKEMHRKRIDYQTCGTEDCENPCSKKCPYLLCRQCCKIKSETEIVICEVK